jgi:hypothetical protein
MKKLFFTCHQGWSDILNSLPLLNYYKEIYCCDIYFLVRKDAEKFVNFYIKNLNIKLILIEKENLNVSNIFQIIKYLNFNENDLIKNHGSFDILRTDEYKNSFLKSSEYFSEAFYTSYNINSITRINYFNIERDLDAEKELYNNFINKHSINYILVHGDIAIEKKENISYVNIDNLSEILFDCIMILENALELHLIDSIWGVLVYLLEGKYKVFKNKNINIYCQRGHIDMFTKPLKLDNINIICN